MASTAPQPHGDATRSAGLVQTLEAFSLVGAIAAMLETGLAATLHERQPITTGDLASHCHLDPARVDMVLEALEAAGVTALADPERTWTMVGSPDAWQSLLSATTAVTPFLDGSARARSAGDSASRDMGERYRSIVEIFTALASPITTSWVARHPLPGARLLELGAGGAPWTRAYLAATPAVTATLVDLSPVLKQQMPGLRKDFPDASIDAVPGDVFTVDLDDGGFDLIVVAGFCRLFDAEMNERLFQRIAGWLAPLGELVVCDAIDIVDDGHRGVANYALSLATRTTKGRIYGYDDFAGWMASAGLHAPTLHPTMFGALTILHSSGLT